MVARVNFDREKHHGAATMKTVESARGCFPEFESIDFCNPPSRVMKDETTNWSSKPYSGKFRCSPYTNFPDLIFNITLLVEAVNFINGNYSPSFDVSILSQIDAVLYI